jgi:cellobiose phosphorylase
MSTKNGDYSAGDRLYFAPRVYDVVVEMIRLSDGIIDPQRLSTFLRGYQEIIPLKVGELWAVPIMARFALIENLRRLSQHLLRTREIRHKAFNVVDSSLEEVREYNERSSDLLLRIAQKITETPEVDGQDGAVHLFHRLRQRAGRDPLVTRWLEQRLDERGVNHESLEQIFLNQQARDQLSIGNTVTALRSVGMIDWRCWFEEVSLVHHELLRDPSGIYPLCDFKTRNLCTQQIERNAKKNGISELQAARDIINLCESAKNTDKNAHTKPFPDKIYEVPRQWHVGHYLLNGNEQHTFLAPLQKFRIWLYLGSFGLLTLLLLIGIITVTNSSPFSSLRSTMITLIMVAVLLVPSSELVIRVIQWVLSHLIKPRPLAKLEFADGIPTYCRTLVAVHGIFSTSKQIKDAINELEVRFIANTDSELRFALLADLYDAPSQVMPDDEEIIKSGKTLINEINNKHGFKDNQKFFVFFRQRVWSQTESKFMGWERKRGKVEELNKVILAKEGTSSLQITQSERELLQTIKFVITLDSDNTLPNQTARKLVGTIAHPLNHPYVDPIERRVTKGYGIIQPRVSSSLRSALKSKFAATFAHEAGVDPYTEMVSDFYFDLFGEASYLGKGVYDVDALHQSLLGRVPQSSLLSHDLFEGLFARTGFASDIELFDDVPSKYLSYIKRAHRWVRGDWQLVPWIGKKVPIIVEQENSSVIQLVNSPLSALSWWKLFDNLRRSLLTPSLYLLFLCSVSIFPGSSIFWIAIATLILSFPLYADLAHVVLIPPLRISLELYFKSLVFTLRSRLIHTLYQITFLPHQAMVIIHGIVISLFRVFISHRNLLEWQTFSSTESSIGDNQITYLKEMALPIFLTLLLIIPALILSSEKWNIGLILSALWLWSPFAAFSLSKKNADSISEFSQSEKKYLDDILKDTWRFFYEYLCPKYHYLIPDNIQLDPKLVVAERTSPTNIGLSLVSILGAHKSGFISIPEKLKYLTDVINTIKKLDKFRGHLFNWYDIATCTPLAPRYISSVDSGNLSASYLIVKSALESFQIQPLIEDSAFERLSSIALSYPALHPLLQYFEQKKPLTLPQIAQAISHLERVRSSSSKTLPDAANKDLSVLTSVEPLVKWYQLFQLLPESVAPHHYGDKISATVQEINREARNNPVSLTLVNQLLEKVVTLLPILATDSTDFIQAFTEAKVCLNELTQQGTTIIASISSLFKEVDYSFLYRQDQRLFRIGFHVDSATVDNSTYDLLASEARILSLVAIAKGDVPYKHWFALGRTLADTFSGKCLASWSGTMFEYLMPLLFMRNHPGTLIFESCKVAVKAQQRYSQHLGIPWGISESAYSRVDQHGTYQYKAFGVPSLALKRQLDQDCVIAPYATLLSTMVEPEKSVANLRLMERLGFRGEYGFFEAVDYSKDRLGAEVPYHIVRAYFSHHQGMGFLALINVLNNGIIREWFHKNPIISSIEELLDEKFPSRVPLKGITVEVEPQPLAASNVDNTHANWSGVVTTPFTSVPHTHILSNGRYTVMVDNQGNGFSAFHNDIALTRWRNDSLTHDYGSFVFVKDLKTGSIWSNTYRPTRTTPESYEANYSADKIEFQRRDGKFTTKTMIVVAQEDDAEIRQITISNTGTKRAFLELTSFSEVSLATFKADAAHPAFQKIFIETEYISDFDALICSRRPRSSTESPLFLVHSLAMSTVWGKTEYETSRESFIGRGNPLSSAQSIGKDSLSGKVGFVLDPIVSLRTRIEIEPGTTEKATFITGVTKSRQDALRLAIKFHDVNYLQRAFNLAWSKSSVELRYENYSFKHTLVFQRVANALFYNFSRLPAQSEALFRNNCSQSALWRLGISGDIPIILCTVSDNSHISLVQDLLFCHNFLRSRGIRFDLVIINEHLDGYLQPINEAIERLLHQSNHPFLINKHGGIHVRSRNHISDNEYILLKALARLLFEGIYGSLESQMAEILSATHNRLTDNSITLIPTTTHTTQAIVPQIGEYFPAPALEFGTNYGGFTDDGTSYTILAQGQKLSPLPWSNVIANPTFGTLVTETGGGYTWSENSRENRLTPFSNDPITDPNGEIVYIRDDTSGDYWAATPRPFTHHGSYHVTHGFGSSRFQTQYGSTKCNLTISVDPKDAIKFHDVKLTNIGSRTNKYSLFFYVEPVMGVSRDETGWMLRSKFDSELQSFIASNCYQGDFAERRLFVGSTEPILGFTGDRREFIGLSGNLSKPQFLNDQKVISSGAIKPLSGLTGDSLDHGLILQVSIQLAVGETKTISFFVGEAPNQDSLNVLIEKARGTDVTNLRTSSTATIWRELLTNIQIRTPSRSFDILMNGWLLYQTISARLWARTGFYQSGGAVGFRDQLQDVLAIMVTSPNIAREQILLHASRQFIEGDVQHWWHPPSGRGVRTRISDDYIWLPYVVAQYINTTSDTSILYEKIAYIEGDLLTHDPEAYITPTTSKTVATVYEHCIKALDRAISLRSVRGLPLMGCGDWNDGMNEVGKKGQGESVWLGWFLAKTLMDFSKLVTISEQSKNYCDNAREIVAAIEAHGWDGQWYRRAYFDDGTPLGSAQGHECTIDSISQSWAIISNLADPERTEVAFESACKMLVDESAGIIKLLTPPFNTHSPSAGYIQGYIPGVRENGGQYTHAAVWMVIAAAKLGKKDLAFQLFSLINPINRTIDNTATERYRGEPYVLCGDVYGVAPHDGRAGWSWYTGSAAWLYQAGLNAILGLNLTKEGISINPNIPLDWSDYDVTIKRDGFTYVIKIKQLAISNGQHLNTITKGNYFKFNVQVSGAFTWSYHGDTPATIPWISDDLKNGVHDVSISVEILI